MTMMKGEHKERRPIFFHWKHERGECNVCGKELSFALIQGLVLESYSKQYMTKEGYDGIVIATNAQFDKKYGTKLKAVLCLTCFVVAKKEYGWQEGPHYDSDSDVL